MRRSDVIIVKKNIFGEMTMKEYYHIIILMVLTILQIIGQIGYYQNVSKNEALREKINPKRYLKFLACFVVLFVAEVVMLVLMLTGVW